MPATPEPDTTRHTSHPAHGARASADAGAGGRAAAAGHAGDGVSRDGVSRDGAGKDGAAEGGAATAGNAAEQGAAQGATGSGVATATDGAAGGLLTLDRLRRGQPATVVAIDGDDALSQRLAAAGLWPGVPVERLATAPLGDPLLFRLHGYRLALRVVEARRVAVELRSAEAAE